jgi:hypothetical protein
LWSIETVQPRRVGLALKFAAAGSLVISVLFVGSTIARSTFVQSIVSASSTRPVATGIVTVR